MCSTLSIHTKILRFQKFLPSFVDFNALNGLFFEQDGPEIENQFKRDLKRVRLVMVLLFDLHGSW